MPVFLYKAIDPTTSRVSEGLMEAENLRKAKEQLRAAGQIPTLLEEKVQSSFGVLKSIPVLGALFTGKIGLKQLNILTQQLATLLDAGIPLIESLYMLEQQTINQRVQEVMHKVRSDIIAGDSFSNALARFPNEFPDLYVSLIRSGEVSGELDGMCFRLAELYDRLLALQNKIIMAMIYPAITVLVILSVVIVILVFVVPQFQQLFASKGAELPMPTQILLALSDFTRQFWWAEIGIVGVTGVWINFLRKGPGKPLFDRYLIKIPVFGTVCLKIYISRFIRTLATVLGSGVSLTESIHAAASTVDNVVILKGFDKAKESLMVGGSLSKPLESTKLFPLMVTRMIGIGEETGELERMLNKSADFLDMEVDAAMETMTKMIEPLMIVTLGLLLLFVALALYMPLFDLGSVMSK